MNNRTTNDRPDDESVTDVATPDQTTTLPGDQAVLRVTRPDWMDPQEWARIKKRASKFFAAQVDAALRSREPEWCIEKHDDDSGGWCTSRTVELDGSDGSGAWWAWVTREPGRPLPQMVIEGLGFGDVTIDVDDLAAVLAATETTEARLALIELLAEVGQELPEAGS